MDWEEVRVRVGQELHKHGDLLRHRVGLGSGRVRLNAEAAGQAGRFFFAEGESSEGERGGTGTSERAKLLLRHLPGEAEEILGEADAICAHRFQLLGYKNLDFSGGVGSGDSNSGDSNCKEIDWHLDPVNGKRAPLLPWFRIPFLDFAVVGDHKVTWELNRHQHLVTLAKARRLSGDEKYTRELMAQWRSWIQANPYPLGINWGSSLEVAFRSMSWTWVDQLLAGTAEGAEFRGQMLPALGFHGRYMERYLSTYFSPNTHLLGEAVALFFLGTLYPQIPGAAGWKECGWKIVRREAGRQVRPDGVYFEQSLHYHVYALDFFLYARLLAARNAMEIPPEYDGVLGRMLEVVDALALAGPAEGFGDDDGGRLWNPRRNRTEWMTDPLALGALMYGRKFSAARLTEESIWLFGDAAVAQLATTTASAAAAAHSFAFCDGGLYGLADSQPFRQTMVVDAGPQGVGRSGHGHADALSLRLTMDGRRWLVDSGSGVYISRDPAERNTFRGTGAHNTLRVDGLNQAVADEPFSWTQIPTTVAEDWIAGKTFTYFVGSHNGYARLADGIVHRRHVLHIAGGVWLIRDIAVGRGEHELEVRWHFASDLGVREVSAGRLEITRAGACESSLSLIMPENTIWQRGTEVSTTLLSPAYGEFETAPLVQSRARVLLPAETATALLPRVAANGRERETHFDPRITSTTQSGVQVYELAYLDGTLPERREQFFFALGDEAWSFGPWSSDARVLYCRVDKERLTHLIVIGGSHVEWKGKPMVKAERRARFLEWRKANAAVKTASEQATEEFSFAPLLEELPEKDSTPNRNSSPYAEKY